MTAIDRYRAALRADSEWTPLLVAESRLPGPRANLALVHAVAREGTLPYFEELLDWTPDRAPNGTAEEFLAVCGAVGLGHAVMELDVAEAGPIWRRLRSLANDPRWRVREGVAMALQWVGEHDFPRLVRRVDPWIPGSLLERRAVVAALCEPVVLAQGGAVEATLDRLDRITASLAAEPDRRRDGIRVLRQALGYGWSVAVAADPARGRPRFER